MTNAIKTALGKLHVRPGQRIGVAVSGGADSVALLRALAELRGELGIVLKVMHFHHGIRGAEADADEKFARALAESLQSEFIRGAGDVPATAKQHKTSLEATARTLRYAFLHEQISAGAVDKVATAHTRDDQAETVLLRLLRGTGMKGLRGVHAATEQGIIRPLLDVGRAEVEQYLRALGQSWREDATNAELHHERNRIRHHLLPLLAKDYNPRITEVLARSAETLAADEEFLEAETERLLPLVRLPGKPVRGGGRSATSSGVALGAEALARQPLAMQRRLVRAVAAALGVHLEHSDVDKLLQLSAGGKVTLSPEWQAGRTARELRFDPAEAPRSEGFSYPLSVPGSVAIREMNIVVHARVLAREGGKPRGTLDGQTLSPAAVLVVRSWKAGDRFRQAYAGAEHKVKELLQEIKPPAELRALWPVIVADGALVWVRDARNRPLQTAAGEPIEIVVEERNGIVD